MPRPRTRDALLAVAADIGCDDKFWFRAARPALALDEDGDGPLVGAYGGTAELPEGVPWPRRSAAGMAKERAAIEQMVGMKLRDVGSYWTDKLEALSAHDDAGGLPLALLARLDLAALPPRSLDLDLPGDGQLLLFYDTANTPWGDDAVDACGFQAIFVPAGTPTVDATPDDLDRTPGLVLPEVPLHATPAWTLPMRAVVDGQPVSLDDSDEHEALWEAIVESEPGLLGGHADWIQDDPRPQAAGIVHGCPDASWDDREALAEDHGWEVLWQIDGDAAGFDPNVPFLYVCGRRADLADGRFDHLWAVFQTT